MTDNVDTDLETGEPVEEAPKSRKKLLLIIGAAALVVLLGGGAGAYFLFLQGPSEEEAAAAAAQQAYFYDLPTMTVNLNSDQDEFLKLSVALELENEQMAMEIEPRMARVVDAFQVYLRELRRADLEGSAGIYRLKEELRRRVNLAIYPAEVDNILFKEILVQ